MSRGTKRRFGWFALACVFPSLTFAGAAWGGETASTRAVRLDQGFVIDLPEGWTLEDPDEVTGDATGRMTVRLVCGTLPCKHTLEVCTLFLRRDPVEGEGDDAARLDGLYSSPTSRYTRIRSALKSTSKDATLRGEFGKVRFGTRIWYAVETQAATRFKSGLFAATVIDGRYLGAICKTCETGEIRHEAARALLGSARRSE